MPNRDFDGAYRVGGVCLIAAGILFLVGAGLSMVIGAAPGGEVYLRTLAVRANVAFANFALFAATDFLLIPGVLALYLALRNTSRLAVAIGSGLLALYCVTDLAVT